MNVLLDGVFDKEVANSGENSSNCQPLKNAMAYYTNLQDSKMNQKKLQHSNY